MRSHALGQHPRMQLMLNVSHLDVSPTLAGRCFRKLFRSRHQLLLWLPLRDPCRALSPPGTSRSLLHRYLLESGPLTIRGVVDPGLHWHRLMLRRFRQGRNTPDPGHWGRGSLYESCPLSECQPGSLRRRRYIACPVLGVPGDRGRLIHRAKAVVESDGAA